MTNERTDNPALLDQARKLPRKVSPDNDLWPGIEARLGEQLPADESSQGASGNVVTLRWQAPALAASLLFALALGYWVGREDAEAPASVPLLAAPTQEAAALQPVGLVEEVGLLEARRTMAADIEAGLTRLPPDARAVVIENLTAIHKALDEIDAVLLEAPASGLDRQLLISMYVDQLARLSSVQSLVMNSNQEILL